MRTRSTPMLSNSRYAIVPVASCVSVWSIFKAISFPAFISPETRCFAMIFCAIVCPIFFLYTSEFYYFLPKRAESISESIVSSSSSETTDTLPSS